MLSNIFKLGGIKQNARELAEKFSRLYPAEVEQSMAKKISAKRLTRYIEEVVEGGVKYKSEHRLGWLGRAIFAHAFKWQLHDLGYSQRFVDTVTEALIVYMMRPTGKE